MTEKAKEQQVAPKTGAGGGPGGKNRVEPPKEKTLKLTVPEMKRIKNDPIPSGTAPENLFRDFAAVHLRASGFPWKEKANVYIAGHRIGFPGTSSDRAFYDLEGLNSGDKVYLEDAEGRKYTYEVYEKYRGAHEPHRHKRIRARTSSASRPAPFRITVSASSTGPSSKTSRATSRKYQVGQRRR